MTNNTLQSLRLLELEEREVALYMALLQLGPAPIREIASKANLNRGTAYESLKHLQQRGIVTYYPKGKRRYFMAENPGKLLILADEKQTQLQEAISLLRTEVIPDLRRLQPNGDATEVRYYEGDEGDEGDEGIEYVLKDILNTVEASEQRQYCVYSAKAIRKYLYRPFPGYTKKRVQKKISVRVIAIGEGGEEAPYSERKWFPENSESSGASYVAIYPPKCVMISLQEGNYPTAIVIESPAIAQVLKLSFDTLWKFL